MFNTSAALSSQDADRRQQAAQVNAQMWSDQASRRLQAAQTLSGLAGARAAGEREDIAAQAALGAQMRGIEQAQRLAPYTALSSQADILSPLPLELFQGRTVNETRHGTEKTTETPGLTDFLDLALRAAGK
ncbi:MAG TPA: hypothetical protein PKB04_10130, partial [Phenylobacterium sp.]|nr:hypothetical protein [Phenylobacterium sp.]